MERMQFHATHLLIREYQRMDSVTEMLVKLGWVALEVRRFKIRLPMYYKI